MNKIFSILTLLFSLSFGHAQNKNSDSLERVLTQTLDDQVRFFCLSELSYDYIYSNPELALKYIHQYILLATKLKSSYHIAKGYWAYSEFYRITGDYPQALEQALKALEVSESSGNVLLIDYSKSGLSLIYCDQGDYARALQICRAAKLDYERHYTPNFTTRVISDTSWVYYYSVHNLAMIYLETSQLDSALKYARLSDSLDQEANSTKLSPDAFLYGNIYSKLGQYDSAVKYYHEGMAVATVPKDYVDNAYGISEIFQKRGLGDSAIDYAKKILEVTRTAHYPVMQMNALKLLATVYKIRNKADSASTYFELAMIVQDKIFNKNKLVQMQNLTFNQQLRQQEIQEENQKRIYRYRVYALLFGVIVLGIVAFLLYRNNKHKQRAKDEVEKAYSKLKSTQAQLIQSEKMASLGELTAGIAHEIQNPLNFVNNFSEVNKELLVEMNDEIAKGNFNEVSRIAKDVIHNQEKIDVHGKRADSIVKGMLQHSRSSSGKKEVVDINSMCDEYLRLAYHGLRAKDKTFTAKFETDFDLSIGQINVVPQDIGRVLLNLVNNAFYAVTEKKQEAEGSYEPCVSISTRKLAGKVEIAVRDNGNGIPEKLRDKIFQPFFTTKPAGQGTGLGLSLAYDIVKAHGGEIKVETKEGEESEFTIQLPT